MDCLRFDVVYTFLLFLLQFDCYLFYLEIQLSLVKELYLGLSAFVKSSVDCLNREYSKILVLKSNKQACLMLLFYVCIPGMSFKCCHCFWFLFLIK